MILFAGIAALETPVGEEAVAPEIRVGRLAGFEEGLADLLDLGAERVTGDGGEAELRSGSFLRTARWVVELVAVAVEGAGETGGAGAWGRGNDQRQQQPNRLRSRSSRFPQR